MKKRLLIFLTLLLIPTLAFGLVWKEDETSYTSVRGSFVDGQAWLDGEILGGELVTDGAFANWTGDDPNAPWAVAGEDANNYITEAPAGVANIVSDNNSYIRLNQLLADLTDGEWYKLTVEIKVNTLGWRFYIENSDQYGSLTNYTTSGIHTFYFTPNGTSVRVYFARTTAGACNFEIDNVSVKKATSLSTQYASTGYRLVLDDGVGQAVGYIGKAGTGLTLDAELVTNGTFDANITGWEDSPAFYDTMEWDAGGKLHLVSDGTGLCLAGSTDNVALVSGTTYKFTFDATVSTGVISTIRIRDTIGSGAAYGSMGVPETGSYTAYFTSANTGNFAVSIYTSDGNTFDGLLDNISVKEVTEPNASAVHIYKERGLVNEGWYSNALTNYNAGTDFDFDVYKEGGGAALW